MDENVPKYMDIFSNLLLEFDRRFEDFRDNATVFKLFAQPFSGDVNTVSEELQIELIELSDSQLRYAKICKHAKVMLSLLGGTYLCEQTFSLMNLNKCKLRNSLSDSYLHDTLTLSVSQLEPDVERKQRQASCLLLILQVINDCTRH